MLSSPEMYPTPPTPVRKHVRYIDAPFRVDESGSVDPLRFETAVRLLLLEAQPLHTAQYLARAALGAWRADEPPGREHWSRVLQTLVDDLLVEPPNARAGGVPIPWLGYRMHQGRRFALWLDYTLEKELYWVRAGCPTRERLPSDRRNQRLRAKRIAAAERELERASDENARAKLRYRLDRMHARYKEPPLTRAELAKVRRRIEIAQAQELRNG